MLTILTFIFCLIPTLLSVRSIMKVGIKPFSLCNLVFFAMFALAPMLDLLNGLPKYLMFPMFYVSTNDIMTNKIYSLFILFGSWYFWLFRGKKAVSFEEFRSNKLIDLFLIIIAFSPVFYFLTIPSKELYLNYGGAGVRAFDLLSSSRHSVLSGFTVLSAVISGYLISKYLNRSFIIIFLLLMIALIDFWLNGKRAIVLFFIISFSLFFYMKNKSMNSLLLIITLLLSFSFFSNWYQSNIRDFDALIPAEERYENKRIDFYRDQRTKMAIYLELNKEKGEILEYRGQSFLMLATFYIPRTIWHNKPLTYSQYFTSAIYGSKPTDLKWGMTTSLFDESIANLGLIGILFPFLFFKYFLDLAFKSQSPVFVIYSTTLVLIMMTVQILAFITLFILWIMWYLKLSLLKKNENSTI